MPHLISHSKMVAFLRAITVLLVILSICDAEGSSSKIDHRIDSSSLNTHHMHTMMRARRLPTIMAYQRLATYIHAGNRFQHNIAAYVANPATPRRKRRRNFLGVMSMDNTADGTTKVTQYTINDSVCPPTEPDTLEKIVQKHIHTLPRYWFSRPVAKHTAEAFQEAMGK